jgi:hypothetical protein
MRDLEMQLVEACPPAASASPTGAVAGMLASHRKRYTMDAERKIHTKMFGAEIAIAAPAVKEETEETDLDALFF